MRGPAIHPAGTGWNPQMLGWLLLWVLVLGQGVKLWAGGAVSRAQRTWATDDSWAALTSA